MSKAKKMKMKLLKTKKKLSNKNLTMKFIENSVQIESKKSIRFRSDSNRKVLHLKHLRHIDCIFDRKFVAIQDHSRALIIRGGHFPDIHALIGDHIYSFNEDSFLSVEIDSKEDILIIVVFVCINV